MVLRVLMFVLISVAVECMQKYKPASRQEAAIQQVACSTDSDKEFSEVIKKSVCKEPKKVFVNLIPPTKLDRVSPSGVWVKRCVGSCEYEGDSQTKCTATTVETKKFYTKIFNQRTMKQRCATYDIEEDVICSCPPTIDLLPSSK